MSNLKELEWFDGGDTYGGDDLHADSPLHYYVVEKDTLDSFTVRYTPNHGAAKYATGFATIDEAKAWAWNHYNEKMQPYVKPLPTWIDVNERLPEEEDFYLVYLFDGHREANVVDILYWNADHQQFLEWDFMNNVTHWQPLPNPPEGE